ncbi:hypothetical protein CPB83DRAFT_760692 [Crepidotus variabilis]|uniref:F-box domain-containing protein n=1 Tax=Crepidotus variabilis TaxID=179855 RepID=A0A9P6EN02_9AGAR|nr:hypothetical protein CPB83DRAFT_760692 [Crepidotus variabilis]
MSNGFIDSLPPELINAILEKVPISDHQATVWSLMKANPRLPIRLSHLFQSIRITQPQQAILLYQHLRRHGPFQIDTNSDAEPHPISWIQDVLVECWTVDADVIINLLRLLPRLRTLSIWIGAHNFSPEHLEELFEKSIHGLLSLSIRFRPYVQRANYYQFLKGAYFDSLLFALAKWPAEDCCPVLSLVQDKFPEASQTFAQPIVFFRLDTCLSAFLHSGGWSSSLTAFQLRLPSRPVIRSMCGTPMAAGTGSFQTNLAPPNLEFLDLSTCAVLDSEIDTVLAHFSNMKHLILDGCPILRGDLREGDWNSLGKRCALVGSKRAKEREKMLKAWTEARSQAVQSAGLQNNQIRPQKQKRGRKGLATSTLSLRKPRSEPSYSLPPGTLTSQHAPDPELAAKVRVIPGPPTLKSLSFTISGSVQPEKLDAVRSEFEAGWAEGIAVLGVTRARLRTSAFNGHIRAMRITLIGAEESEQWDDGLDGLEDVDPEDESFLGKVDDGSNPLLAMLDAPVLCFAGYDEGHMHSKHCGHLVAERLMGAQPI